MDEIKLITFFPVCSRSKKNIINFYKRLQEHAKTYGYLTIQDYIRIWKHIPANKEDAIIEKGSTDWGVTVHDFPAKISIKKHPINGYYLHMPSTYLL